MHVHVQLLSIRSLAVRVFQFCHAMHVYSPSYTNFDEIVAK